MGRTVMIIESNANTLKQLSDIVEQVIPNVTIMAFSSLDGSYDCVMQHTVDLFVLDIVIDKNVANDTSGIRFARQIRTISRYEFTPIIFITALEDPKLYAYTQLHCFGYIEKPFDEKIVKREIERTLRFPATCREDNSFFFHMDGILYSVKISEIIYMESVHHKIHIHENSGKTMIIPYRTCRQIITEADNDSLLQCSRNTIINKNYVDSIDLPNRFIRMRESEEVLDIGFTYRDKIKKEFCYDFFHNLRV
jgi:DNA-binding LytR/AlgR family response regulator